MASESVRVFHPDIESVEEFIQRFKLQNATAFVPVAADDAAAMAAASMKRAMLIANSLPITVLTDIQQRLKPTLLTAARYEDLERHLIASYGDWSQEIHQWSYCQLCYT